MLGDSKTSRVSPVFHLFVFIVSKGIPAYGLNTLEIIWGLLSFISHFFYHVYKERKKEETFICTEGFCKERTFSRFYFLHVFLMKQKPVGLWFISLLPL